MNKIYVGIDNGISGTIGIISNRGSHFFKTPSFKEQSYTKTKQNISRIDYRKLSEIFGKIVLEAKENNEEIFVALERPLINASMFKSSISAARSLESTLILIEMFEMPYIYIDSKEWQRALLPKGIKGSANLKKASKEIGCRLFPKFKELITKHKDADGILIAEYLKRNNF